MRTATFLCILAVLLAGCGRSSATVGDVDDPQPAEHRVVSAKSLDVGDCIEAGTQLNLIRISVIDCDEPHELETISRWEFPMDEYPGESVAIGWAELVCGENIEIATDAVFDSSSVDAFYLYPTEASWAVGDRSIACMAWTPLPATGSVLVDAPHRRIRPSELSVGDCVELPDTDYFTVTLIDCDDAHTWEVFQVTAIDPTDRNLDHDALFDVYCADSFGSYVGIPFDDSTLLGLASTPSSIEFDLDLFTGQCLAGWSDEPRTGSVADAGQPVLNSFAIGSGDCFDSSGPEFLSVVPRPCNGEHRYEFVADIEFDDQGDDSFPGQDVLEAFAFIECEFEVDDYIGMPATAAGAEATFLTPTAETWEGGDRLVTCLATSAHAGPLLSSPISRGAGLPPRITLASVESGWCFDEPLGAYTRSASCDGMEWGKLIARVWTEEPASTPYPGMEALGASAEARCALETGLDATDPSLWFFVADAESWDLGDRWIQCVVLNNGSPTA